MTERGPRADPERLAQFRVLARLGQGGMGVVYRAEDEKLRRHVALKVLPAAVARDEERRKRFLREARAAAALTHPNIATVYDVGEQDGRVFITGDFASAIPTFSRLDAHVGTLASDLRAVQAFEAESMMFVETGQPDRALALADAFMKRLPVLTRQTDFQGRDVVLSLWRRAGRISDAEFRATREGWAKDAVAFLTAEQTTGWAWFAFYGESAASALDAREALDALAQFSPLSDYEGDAYAEAVMGRVLLLAGRVDEAIPHLRRAVSACFVPHWAQWHQWAAELLGEALEAKGDQAGACAAYGEVLVHWGSARPRSVTADKSRAHMKTLGCGK